MSRNAVLQDKDGNQVMPITTGDAVYYDANTTVKDKIDQIIGGSVVVNPEPWEYDQSTELTSNAITLININDVTFDEIKIYIEGSTNTVSGVIDVYINENDYAQIGLVEGLDTKGIVNHCITFRKIGIDYLTAEVVGATGSVHVFENPNLQKIEIKVMGSPSLRFETGTIATVFKKESN